jgi:hypothetical protein
VGKQGLHRQHLHRATQLNKCVCKLSFMGASKPASVGPISGSKPVGREHYVQGGDVFGFRRRVRDVLNSPRARRFSSLAMSSPCRSSSSFTAITGHTSQVTHHTSHRPQITDHRSAMSSPWRSSSSFTAINSPSVRPSVRQSVRPSVRQ